MHVYNHVSTDIKIRIKVVFVHDFCKETLTKRWQWHVKRTHGSLWGLLVAIDHMRLELWHLIGGEHKGVGPWTMSIRLLVVGSLWRGFSL